jgi:formylglycine-generating enzyme required for sulfatase activity
VTNPSQQDNSQNQKTYKGLYGKLVTVDGKAAVGAMVRAIDIGINPGSITSTDLLLNDQVTTDDFGYYWFESLKPGVYNLEGRQGGDNLSVFIPNITYDGDGAVKKVETDTLRPSGRISGAVATHSWENAGVECFLPGTWHVAFSDDTGGFVLQDIPQGNFTISYNKKGFFPSFDSVIILSSGENKKLPIINMEADPASPPPAPAGLSVSYDTLKGCALLTWNSVLVSDLAGYTIVFWDSGCRRVDSLSGTRGLVRDTFFVDTLFPNLFDTNDWMTCYQVKARDLGGNASSRLPDPVAVYAPSPTRVRTFFSWKFPSAPSDSISIGDTVSIIVSYKNATRRNARLSWFFGNKSSAIRTTIDSSLCGSDTIRHAWQVASKAAIYVSMVDQATVEWWDSASIVVVQDIPKAEAGNDTAVLANENVSFAGAAKQRFGSLVMYKWDFDGDGVYDDSSATSGRASHGYSHGGVYNAKLLVRDDDGNEAVDTRVVTVGDRPPVIRSIRSDTTISIGDSLSFFGTATGGDGRILEYAWDFDGNGIFEYSSSEKSTAGHTYANAGIINAVLRVTDNGGKTSSDTVRITVIRDAPVAFAGSDTCVAGYGIVRLHGSASQQFGTIVRWEWDIGNTGIFTKTSRPDTNIIAPASSAPTFSCVLRVLDDDGNSGMDTVKIAIVDMWLPSEPLEHSGSMVKIKAKGFDFEMGQPCDTVRGKTFDLPTTNSEQPVHKVSFTHDFWMDTVEVTQGEFDSLMKITYGPSGIYRGAPWSSTRGNIGHDVAAYDVLWGDAALFCNARSKCYGLPDTAYSYTNIIGRAGNLCSLKNVSVNMNADAFRLPTEAEWEYACRAGTTSDYYWGKDFMYYRTASSLADVDSHEVWYNNSFKFGKDSPSYGVHEVGKKKPNRYGLYDMTGNVSEWCNDLFDTYAAEAVTDPAGPAAGGAVRVMRGGNWGTDVTYLRSTERQFYAVDYPIYFMGFRVVRQVR